MNGWKITFPYMSNQSFSLGWSAVMRTACVMTQDFLIKKDIYMKINKLKLLGKVAVSTRTHTHTPLYPKNTSWFTNRIWEVMQCSNMWSVLKTNRGTQRQQGHFIHWRVLLLCSLSPLSHLFLNLSLSLSLSLIPEGALVQLTGKAVRHY